MAIVMWGFSWSVDAHGNIFKDGNFVPSRNFKFVPGNVLDMARRVKADRKKVVSEIDPSPRESIGGKVTAVRKTAESSEFRDTGNDVKFEPTETSVGTVAKNIVSSTADFADSAVRTTVSSFGGTAILLLGVAFVLSAVGRAFRKGVK